MGFIFGGGDSDSQVADQSNQLAREQFEFNRAQAAAAAAEAARLRNREDARQASVRQAIADINAMFQGGTVGAQPVANPVAGLSYYDAAGNPVTYRAPTTERYISGYNRVAVPGATYSYQVPVPGGPIPGATGATGPTWEFDPNSGRMASKVQIPNARAVVRNKGGDQVTLWLPNPVAPTYETRTGQHPTTYREDPIYSTRTIAGTGPVYGTPSGAATRSYGQGFGDEFFRERAQAHQDYYLPQVEEQYNEALTGLNYNLARSGLTRSTAGAAERAKLASDRALREGEVRSAAEGEASQLRGNIDNIRRSLIAQAEASETPGTIANVASTQLTNLQNTPLELSTLGELFAGAGSALGGYRTGLEREQAEDYVRQGVAAPGLPSGGSGRRIG